MLSEISKKFYRYDLKFPPKDWDANFKNDEYCFEKFGDKNKADLFFFTDSLDIAKGLGENAAKKEKKEEYYLTYTETQSLNLIDFSNCITIYVMLCVLKDLKIDVLDSGFKTFEDKSNYEDQNTFAQLKSNFEAAELETDSTRKREFIEKLIVDPVSYSAPFMDIGLFGQRLTDFENGILFKKTVNKINSNIDGYIWREFGDTRGFTYCLFDSRKLLSKETERISL